MTRILRVAAVQVGRIDRGTPKSTVVQRLTALLEDAAQKQVKLAVFPETTFSEGHQR
jgi:predicted amidohydrolase